MTGNTNFLSNGDLLSQQTCGVDCLSFSPLQFQHHHLLGSVEVWGKKGSLYIQQWKYIILYILMAADPIFFFGLISRKHGHSWNYIWCQYTGASFFQVNSLVDSGQPDVFFLDVPSGEWWDCWGARTQIFPGPSSIEWATVACSMCYSCWSAHPVGGWGSCWYAMVEWLNPYSMWLLLHWFSLTCIGLH